MITYELKPTETQSQKSFYGKATIERISGNETLYSCGVKIMTKKYTGEIVRHWNGEKPNGKWSQTTGRHIFAFCGMRKKDFDKLPVVEQ